MRWVRHVARIGGRDAWKVLVAKPQGNLKDLGVDGKIMFKFFFQKTDGDMDWII